MRDTFERRKRIVLELLKRIPGVTCQEPKGAFYVFPDFSEHFGRTIGGTRVESADVLASILLKECRVATVPGTGFGEAKALRLSYAASEGELQQGLERITRLLA
jgi:aspartate aminotransferase